MDERFLERAVELSRQGARNGEGGPFGAVIVRDATIVAEATNRVLATGDPTNHAEILAIRNACAVLENGDLSDCELYTNCEPCPMCVGAIYWARLARVYFANTSQDAAAIGFADARIHRELEKPVEQREIRFERRADELALQVFREWNAREDTTQY